MLSAFGVRDEGCRPEGGLADEERGVALVPGRGGGRGKAAMSPLADVMSPLADADHSMAVAICNWIEAADCVPGV